MSHFQQYLWNNQDFYITSLSLHLCYSHVGRISANKADCCVFCLPILGRVSIRFNPFWEEEFIVVEKDSYELLELLYSP